MGIPRNKFPIPEQTLYGCKCATVERTGQDTGQDANFLYFRRGEGVVTPRNKFPIPEQTLYGCKCATVERTGQDTGQDAHFLYFRTGEGGSYT